MYHLFCLPVNFHIYHLKDTAVSIPVEWRWCWMHATLLLNFWCRTCLLDILSVIRLHLHASLMHWIYAVKQASLDVLVFLFMWFLTCRTKCCLMCYRQVLFSTFVFMLHFMCLPWWAGGICKCCLLSNWSHFYHIFVKIGQNVYGHDTGQFSNWSVSPCLLWSSDSVIVKTPNYTVSGKKWNHSIFAYNFAKCWPIFKNLSPADLAVNF